MSTPQPRRAGKAHILRIGGTNISEGHVVTGVLPGTIQSNDTEEGPGGSRSLKKSPKCHPRSQAGEHSKKHSPQKIGFAKEAKGCEESMAKGAGAYDEKKRSSVTTFVRESCARVETPSRVTRTAENQLGTIENVEDSIPPAEMGCAHPPTIPRIGAQKSGVSHSKGDAFLPTELKAPEMTVPPGNADGNGDERVRIWDPVGKLQLSGNAAPRRKRRAEYLKKHPERVEYSERVLRGIATPKRIRMWDTAIQRRLIGRATPTEASVLEYLVRYPERNIYNGQDMPDYVGDKRTANQRIPLLNATRNHKIVGKEAPLRAGAQAFVEQNEGYAVYWGQDVTRDPVKLRRWTGSTVVLRTTSVEGADSRPSCSRAESREILASPNHGDLDPVQRYYQNILQYSTPVVPETSAFSMDGLYHSDGDEDVGEYILPSLEPDWKYLEDWNF